MTGASSGGPEVEGGEEPAVYAHPEPPQGVRVVPTGEKSRLGAKLAAGRFIVSVEVNPPAGLDPARAIAAAKMLIDGG
ncbi:MAG: hypothetical protein WCJ30_19690, partial [Deltaproteobacteria bacterium]